MVGMYIIIPIVTFIIGGLLAWLGMRFLLKSKYDSVLQEAEKEAEVIKKNKMLEVKEKFLHLKADLEKQVSQRNAKIQSVETKLKQRELTMNQRQEELQRRNNEVEAVKENLSSQLELVEKKKQDLDKLHQKAVEHLEAISGLSAEEAKERLIESLKDEAKTQAASYINEIVEEAKMTANKEAKKIVIQSIQRVATETAIENSITVFHIESDEIKGRIIGREGRNIRALEAATGIEIVVDDTPEAIVLSGFDPVRREIARLALHQLVQDGRIHPARIEEVVTKVKKQVEDEVVETGKRTVIDLGVHGLHPELIRMIGKMKYRSSYGQNLLQHARETANLCAVMASELGLNPKKAKRAGLLHDIGKVPDDEPELPPAVREVGADGHGFHHRRRGSRARLTGACMLCLVQSRRYRSAEDAAHAPLWRDARAASGGRPRGYARGERRLHRGGYAAQPDPVRLVPRHTQVAVVACGGDGACAAVGSRGGAARRPDLLRAIPPLAAREPGGGGRTNRIEVEDMFQTQ